ncbi:hypothetical protein [Algirhabdus cladophorae]|uniref:hypothetical protein n=1 Tax=Algirhabdus cladophorae TaxID=3377108 RepID=UPI003B848CAA
MEQVAILTHEERVHFDPDRLTELYAELGELAAETVVCRALEELSIKLRRIEAAFWSRDIKTVHDNASGLIEVAEQIGMHSLARVASDVAGCVASGDVVALGGTLARLLRVGDQSLSTIWDEQSNAF